MPSLKIVTNISKSAIPKDFIQKLIPVLVKCVRKPADKFVVSVSADCFVSVNGKENEPSVISNLECIGHLGPNENKIIARDVTEHISKELGVEKDQIFLTFYDLEAYNVAKNGETIG